VTHAAMLGERALNRATLARQLLLERADMTPHEAIGHLVGLQAQTPKSWYLTLWSRLRDFDPVATGGLLEERRVVRSWFMRFTIHLVTDVDAPTLRTFSRPTLERTLRGKWRERLAGIDLAELAAEVRAFTDRAPRTPTELVAHLATRWPEGPDALTLTNAVKALVPLVQVPPRGVWGRAGAVRLASLEAWLGRPVAARIDPAPIVRRYLAAYGPASVADMQVWSGVSGLGDVFERLRSQLISFRDEGGRELFDLPDAPRPEPDTPAPVRFLADFDNLLLSHANRRRFVKPDDREALTYRAGPIPGMFLVDGRVAGAWHATVDDGAVTARVRPLAPLRPDHEAAVRREAASMLTFNYPTATERVVEVVPLSGR
jgi:hypothetical protein